MKTLRNNQKEFLKIKNTGIEMKKALVGLISINMERLKISKLTCKKPQ
jgi:hypothetical protein